MSTTNEKLTRLKHLSALATRTKNELEALDNKIQEIVTVGGQPNTIEEIYLNDVKITPDENKAVKLTVTHPEYTVVKDDDSGEYAAVYHLTKDGANVGAAINIPKDIVVKSGSVVGDEIVLVLNDTDATEIKIPVGSLIEYVTSGSATGDMVVITVDETTHKVTATITDGTISAVKLTTEVQTALNKAHEHANKTELELIATGDKAKWDAAVADIATVKGDYLKAADKYDDTALAGRVSAIEGDYLKAADKYDDTALAGRVSAIEGDYLKAADKTELQDAIDGVDAKFASYYTSTQIDAMIATDADVTSALDEVFGSTEA